LWFFGEFKKYSYLRYPSCENRGYPCGQTDRQIYRYE